jgi:cell division transport system permease protein
MSYAFREAIAATRRAPVLTGLSAAMVGLALYVVSLFALVAYNMQIALTSVEERVELVVYLRDDGDPVDLELAREELASMPEVDGVQFISKDDALEKAQAELPEFGDLFTDLDANPLPASLEISLHPGSRTPNAVGRVAERAASYPVAEDVRFGREWLDKLYLLRRMGAAATSVLGLAFALAAALIIGTAVRLAVFARRDEIYIMRLVGARDGFIRRPFLIEGALTGLLGGVAAAGLAYVTFRAVTELLFELAWLPTEWVTGGLVAGMIFGLLASGAAVRRYLREV